MLAGRGIAISVRLREREIALLRLAIALLMVIALGFGPAAMGIGKAAASSMHDCAGKAGKPCPCDDGPSPCGTVTCMAACQSAPILNVAGVQILAIDRPNVFLEPDTLMLSEFSSGDPPVPRA